MTIPSSSPVTEVSPGHWRVAGTRVSLDSIVIAYWNGESVRTTVENYPSLTVEQVEAAIVWYLANRAIVDAGMKETEKRWKRLEEESHVRNAELHQRIKDRLASRTESAT